MAGIQLASLLVVGGMCAAIGLLGTPREHGVAAPAAIGVGAGLVSAAFAQELALPTILPVGVGALVCPAVWAVVGATLLVGALRLAVFDWRRAEAK